MTDGELADLLVRLGTASLCTHEAASPFGGSFRPLLQDVRTAGRAKTAATLADQNAVVHRAIHWADQGDLLVVDGGAEWTNALFGGLLAQFCKTRGVVGAVIRGCVRDVTELRTLGMPVWCTGTNPASSKKDYPGLVGTPLHFGNALICAGDWVVADDDGIAVIPAAAAERAAEHAGGVEVKERTISERIAAGESTCAIFSVKP